MKPPNPQIQHFNQLLTRIRREVNQLKSQNQTLEKENKALKKSLEEAENQTDSVFSALGESDRIALRHQIDGLIAKIDKHLER